MRGHPRVRRARCDVMRTLVLLVLVLAAPIIGATNPVDILWCAGWYDEGTFAPNCTAEQTFAAMEAKIDSVGVSP
jgi:hypothetical protein